MDEHEEGIILTWMFILLMGAALFSVLLVVSRHVSVCSFCSYTLLSTENLNRSYFCITLLTVKCKTHATNLHWLQELAFHYLKHRSSNGGTTGRCLMKADYFLFLIETCVYLWESLHCGNSYKYLMFWVEVWIIVPEISQLALFLLRAVFNKPLICILEGISSYVST